MIALTQGAAPLTLRYQKNPDEAKQEAEVSRQKAVEFFKRGCSLGNGEVRASRLTSRLSAHLCEGLLFCVGVRAADLLGAEPVLAARAQGVAEQRLAEAVRRCRLQGLPRQQ